MLSLEVTLLRSRLKVYEYFVSRHQACLKRATEAPSSGLDVVNGEHALGKRDEGVAVPIAHVASRLSDAFSLD